MRNPPPQHETHSIKDFISLLFASMTLGELLIIDRLYLFEFIFLDFPLLAFINLIMFTTTTSHGATNIIDIYISIKTSNLSNKIIPP